MSIPVVCPKCSAKLNAPDSAAGKRVKCPKCQALMHVPEFLAAEPEEPEFEVIEDAPPPKKAPIKPKAVAKADVEIDDEDDDRPRKKKRRTEEDDEEDDDRPKKKKKKRQSEDDEDEGRVSMTRNIVMVVLLIVLLGVAAWVFYDRSQKKDASNESPAPSADSAAGPPVRPAGSGGDSAKGKPKDRVNTPKFQEPNPYTGAGVQGGTAREIEAVVKEPFEKVYTRNEWCLTLADRPGIDGKQTARIYLKPDQWLKVNDLWPGQKVKVRGLMMPNGVVPDITDGCACEIVSAGPAPAFVELTVDQLLKEFQSDEKAARRKWSGTGKPETDPPWIKLTGIYDGPGPKEATWPTIKLKGTGADDAKPNRILINAGMSEDYSLKSVKPGDRVTLRVMSLASPDPVDGGQVHFTRALSPPPKS